jgi:hypothetical protein
MAFRVRLLSCVSLGSHLLRLAKGKKPPQTRRTGTCLRGGRFRLSQSVIPARGRLSSNTTARASRSCHAASCHAAADRACDSASLGQHVMATEQAPISRRAALLQPRAANVVFSNGRHACLGRHSANWGIFGGRGPSRAAEAVRRVINFGRKEPLACC